MVVTVPFGKFRDVPVEPLAGKIVLDINNDYWERDGRFAELDRGEATTSGLPARPGGVLGPSRRGRLRQDLYDRIGFDTVDVSPLSESWRVERDRPAYVVKQTKAELEANLAKATRTV